VFEVKFLSKIVFVATISSSVVYAMGPGGGGKGSGMGGPGSMGPGKGNMEQMQSGGGMAKYNSNNLITLKAKVSKVGKSEFNQQNAGSGMHIYVSSDNGYYKVHVAPDFWIEANSISFKEGDKLTITGAEIIDINMMRGGKGGDFGGGDSEMYAATIVREDGEVIKLRDEESGKGLWKGGMEGMMKNKNMQSKQQSTREEMQKKMQEKMMKQMQNQNAQPSSLDSQ
jgi:hypothetical protein